MVGVAKEEGTDAEEDYEADHDCKSAQKAVKFGSLATYVQVIDAEA